MGLRLCHSWRASIREAKQKGTGDGALLVDRGSLWLSARLLTQRPTWPGLLAPASAPTRSSWPNFKVALTFPPDPYCPGHPSAGTFFLQRMALRLSRMAFG